MLKESTLKDSTKHFLEKEHMQALKYGYRRKMTHLRKVEISYSS